MGRRRSVTDLRRSVQTRVSSSSADEQQQRRETNASTRRHSADIHGSEGLSSSDGSPRLPSRVAEETGAELGRDSFSSVFQVGSGSYGFDDDDSASNYLPHALSTEFVTSSNSPRGSSPTNPGKSIDSSGRTDGTTSEVSERSQEELLQIVSTLSQAEMRTLQRVLSAAMIASPDGEENASSARLTGDSVRSVPPELFDYTTLSEDTHSFLITAKIWSIPFATAVFVMIMKASLLMLVVASMVSGERPDNRFGIPPSVTGSVVVSQFLALFVAVLTQDDLLTALKLIYEGYAREVMETAFLHSSHTKWVSAVVSLFFGGLLALVVTFLLIVTSSDVVELLLNFTAIEFVSLLDNSVFFLASRGFVGKHNKVASEIVSRTQLKIREDRRISYGKQMLILFLTFLLLVAGWTVVFVQQTRGKYLANGLIVQFDDALSNRLGTYSGIYKVDLGGWWITSGLSLHYTDENNQGHFRYCADRSVWAFHLEPGEEDPCDIMVACSPFTDSFDIATTGSQTWTVTNGDGRFYPSPEFRLSHGCLYNEDCGGFDRGICENHQCICDSGYFGYRCDYVMNETCSLMTVLSDEFAFRGSRAFATDFRLLTTDKGEIIEVYGKAVYFAEGRVGTSLDVVLFTGLRWALLRSDSGLLGLDDHTEAGLADFLVSSGFHASTSLGVIQFVSEPVRFNTPNDGATPADLTWFRVKSGEAAKSVATLDVASSSRLVCGYCGKSNPCSFGNECSTDNICSCTNGATGKFCENAPVGDGHCDVHFNTAEYEFDGGDCCKATCVSTEDYVCGTKNKGSLQNVPIGFAHCIDPSVGCREEGENCWLAVGSSIRTLAETGVSVVRVSANGLTLVFGEPLLSAVRVFDRVDSRWVQRGAIIEGTRGDEFGKTMALSTRPGSVKKRRFGKVPMHLAIGFHGPWEGFCVVGWDPNHIDWSSVGENVRICARSQECELDSIDIGATSLRVSVAARFKNETLFVYSAALTESGNEVWEKTYETNRVKAFALSGQGRHVVFSRSLKEEENLVLVELFRGDEVGINAATIDANILAFHALRLSFDGTVIVGLYMSNSTTDGVFRTYSSDFRATPDRIVATTLPKSAVRQPILSTEGNALAIFDTTSGMQLFRPVNLDIPSYGWRPVDPKLGDDRQSEHHGSQRFELPPASNLRNIDISGDGSMVALADDSSTQAAEISSLCSKEEEEVHVSIVLDEKPTGVSWSLEIVRRYGDVILTHKSIRACSGCYDNNNRYGLTTVVERVCVAKDDRSCVGWKFGAETGLTQGSGYIVVSSTGDLWRPGGNSTEMSFDFVGSGEGCDGDVVECGGGLALFLLALSGGRGVDELTWELRESESGMHLGSSNAGKDTANETVSEAGTTMINQLCIPELGTFIVKVSANDFAAGEAAMYMDSEEIKVIHVAAGRSAFVEFARGSPPLLVEPEFEVLVYLEVVDGREVRWSIQDTYGFRENYDDSERNMLLRNGASYTFSFPNGTDGITSFQVYMGSSKRYDRVLLLSLNSASNSSFTAAESFVDPVQVAELLDLAPISVVVELNLLDGAALNPELNGSDGERYNRTIAADEAANLTLSFFVQKDSHYEITLASDTDGYCCTGALRVYLGSEPDNDNLLLFIGGQFKSSTYGRFRTNANQTVGLIPITVFMKVDRPTTNLGWKVQILAEGGYWDRFAMNHALVNGTVMETLQVPDGYEYQIVVEDADQLDGLCCSYGEGSYSVYMGEGVDETRLLAVGDGEFLYRSEQTFNLTVSNAAVFPAPIQNATAINVTVEVSLDDKPSSLGWSIVDNRTNFAVERILLGTYITPNVVVESVVSLVEGQGYWLKAVDNSSDGLCCEGDRNYVRKLRVLLDDGSLLTESDGSFHVGYDGVATKSVGFVASHANAIPDPFYILDTFDSSSATNLTNPIDLILVAELDRYPEEFGFYIRDVAEHNVIAAASPGNYTEQSSIEEVIQVERRQLYEIGLIDTGGDGICCSNGFGSFTLFWQNKSSMSRLLHGSGEPALLSRYEFLAEEPVGHLFEDLGSQSGMDVPELENPVTVLLVFVPNCLPWGSGWLIRDKESLAIMDVREPGYYESFLGESIVEEALLEKDQEYEFAFQSAPADEGIFCGRNNVGSIMLYYGSEANASMMLLESEMHSDTSFMQSFNASDPTSTSGNTTTHDIFAS